MKDRIVSFDLARAFCVIWIVGILHVIGYIIDPKLIPSTLVKLLESITVSSLATFTFLSGYFVAGDTAAGRDTVIEFYKKRLIRFAILYTIACASLYIAGIVLSNDVRWFKSFSQLIATLVGLSGLIPNYQPATFWYFSMIILFYLLTPFIMFAKTINKKLSVMALILTVLFVETTITSADIRLPFYFIFYALGALCKNRRIKLVLNNITLSLIMFISLFLTINLEYYLALQNFFIGILGLLLILSLSAKICQAKVVSLLSLVAYGSMCSYLFHRHLYAFIKKIYNGDFWPVYIWPLAVIGIFILGFAIQMAYDKFINILNQRERTC